ncbi:MAG: capsular exopolysaccharide family [Frankiales bacterium]|nr:capsular exopolysaccharide family [Frankiales bacterium]
MASHPEILAIRRYAPAVLACVLLGTGAGGALVVLTPKQYESRVVVFVAAARTPDGGSVYDRALFAQDRVRSYVPLVASPLVMDRVARSLQLTESPLELGTKLTVTAAPDTVLLSITVRESTPRLAQLVASETARQFTAFVTTLEGESGGAPTVSLTVTRPAQFEAAAVLPRRGLDLWLGAFLGGALGMVVTALRRRWAVATEPADRSPSVEEVTATALVSHPVRLPEVRVVEP